MIFHLRNTGAPHECKSTWSFSSILEYFHVRTPVLPFFLFEHYQMHKRIYLILKIFISISILSPRLTSLLNKKSFIKITSAYYCSIFINYFQT